MHKQALGSKKSATRTSVPQTIAKAETVERFDFLALQQQVSRKPPTYSGRAWRQRDSNVGGAPSFTRKRFERQPGSISLRYNPSRAWVDGAERTANFFQSVLSGNPKLDAACKYLEKGKFLDTKEGHDHLKVLATAQQKCDAKLEAEKAQGELAVATEPWQAACRKLDAAMQKDVATVRSRMTEMYEVRSAGRAAKGKRNAGEIGDVHASARFAAGHLKRRAMEPLPRAAGKKDVPPKNKPGGSQADIPTRKQLVRQDARQELVGSKKLKSPKSSRKKSPATVLMRKYFSLPSALKSERKAGAETKHAKRLLVRKKAKKFEPPQVLNREALREFIRSSAEKSGTNPRKLIEYFLLDLPVGAYIPDEMYDALRDLYVELNDVALKEYAAAEVAEMKPLYDEVERRTVLANQKWQQYDALPSPA